MDKSFLNISCAQYSQAGTKEINEDSIGIRMPDGDALKHKGVVAVIADGVSAAEAGREASQACVQNLLYDYYCTPEIWVVEKSMLQVLNALNRWLYTQGSHFHDSEKGYITTLSILILKGATAHIFHIGDSRIYRYRNNEIEQLTKDHTRKVGDTSYLARAMGLDSKIEIDYSKQSLEEGDIFVLSTDGIHDFFPAHNWKEYLAGTLSLEEQVHSLHKEALNNDSNDNLSCQIIKVENVGEVTKEEAYKALTSLPLPPLLKRGQTIDGLQVESTLYESNKSQLYIVRDTETQKQYVMKTPSVNFEDDPNYLDRFIKESWLGKRLRHGKLVKVLNPPKAPTCLYYLMEYVDGVTLERWIKTHNKPSLESVVRVATQIALGLRYLHRQQIVHQDLKPGNIVIDENEQLKLIDLGACSVLAYGESASYGPEVNINYNLALGTASYSAPEAHLLQKLDSRSDIFSMAVIVYEMLTGQLPYGNKYENLKDQVGLSKLRYQPAHKHNQYVPDWCDAALKKALSLNPEGRYQEVDEFIYDLKHPNKSLKSTHGSLLDEDPLKFWKAAALIELFAILALLSFLLSQN